MPDKDQEKLAKQAEEQTQQAKEAQEKDLKERGPKDPVTNQPASDFQAKVPPDSPDADAVKVQSDAMRVGSALGRHAEGTTLVETRERERVRAEEAKAAGDITEAYPKADATYAMIPPDVYRAREQARVMQEAANLGTSTTIPGGAYLVGGQLVDANGEPVKDDKAVKAEKVPA